MDASALQAELMRRAIAVPLTLATLKDVTCHALTSDGRGSFAPLAANATSGMPPYNAVFNLCLQGKVLARTGAALQGRRQFLAIEYRTTRCGAARARTTFSARRTVLGPFWQIYEGEGSAAELLERAVAQENGCRVSSVMARVAASDAPRNWLRHPGLSDSADSCATSAGKLLPRNE